MKNINNNIYISVLSIILFAGGLWLMDLLGIERWTAEQLGKYARMIVDGYEMS